MALLMRRGKFEDFDDQKLVPGEFGVVVSGDPAISDGQTAYLSFGTGRVKQIAMQDDIPEAIYNANTELIDSIVAETTYGIESAISDCLGVADYNRAQEAERVAAENQRKTSEASRVSDENTRKSQENSRKNAEAARVVAEAKRVTDFDEMQRRANGWFKHFCTSGEYSTSTKKPTVTEPDTDTIYFVPNSSSGDNQWVEWIYDGTRWEKLGAVENTIVPITSAQIDDMSETTAQTGSEVTTLTSLSYFFIKNVVSKFAKLSHRHNMSNLDGTLPLTKGGTGATAADSARTSLGAASQADLAALIARVEALEAKNEELRDSIFSRFCFAEEISQIVFGVWPNDAGFSLKYSLKNGKTSGIGFDYISRCGTVYLEGADGRDIKSFTI